MDVRHVHLLGWLHLELPIFCRTDSHGSGQIVQREASFPLLLGRVVIVLWAETAMRGIPPRIRYCGRIMQSWPTWVYVRLIISMMSKRICTHARDESDDWRVMVLGCCRGADRWTR